MSEYVSRVIKIDALTLDLEFYSLIRNQIFQIFNQLKIGHWTHKYGPEIEIGIKFLIWKFSVFRMESSIGQALLGVKYPSDKRKLKLLFLLESLVPYLYERLITSFRSHLAYRKMEKPIKWCENFIKICEIVNFCIFLMQNRYPSLINRIVRLPIIPAYQRVHHSIGYSYQVRELLWHQFADFLMIILPVLNIHRIKRYLKEWGIKSPFQITSGSKSNQKEVETNEAWKCCVCKQDAIIPQHIDSCTFCYYCIKANVMADPEFKCFDCLHNQN